ncbi:MAG: C10 family peptidase [Prevotella sp.]
MKKVFLSSILVLMSFCMTSAKPRTALQMRSAALAAIRVHTPEGPYKAAPLLSDMKVLRQESQITVIGYEGGRYAVIANDDVFKPVLGYGDNALGDNPAPAFVWWMTAVNESLEEMLATGNRPAEAAPPAGYKKTVPELLTTRWGQDTPYNLLCPVYNDGKNELHYITGCVATSMAQVMNYHQYPVKGQGSKSYFFYPEGSDQRSRAFANFGNTTYDYANMLDEYTGNNYTAEQANAVATLMYHAGVSVEMGYNPGGSGAYSNDACRALRKYFLYDENIKFYSREYFPVDEWMSIIYRELNDGCPIIYGGATRSNEGHSFVVDGYDENGLVHVNWGWTGTSNGFYDIASLRGFTEGQDMIIVRRPDDNRFVSQYTSLWALGYTLAITQSLNNLLISCNGLYNMDVENFTGNIGAMAADMSSGVVTSLGVVRTVSEVEPRYGTKLTNVSVSCDNLADGTYRIYLATKSEKETSWQPVRSKEDINNSYILVKNGKNITLTAGGDSNWTSSIDVEKTVSDGTVNVFNLAGQMIYSAPAATFRAADIPATGVLILRDANGSRKIVK